MSSACKLGNIHFFTSSLCKLNLVSLRFTISTSTATMALNKTKHLKTGDPQPPIQNGLLRLYSMRFCPYAQRVHLVLDTKKIPYDTVFVNLVDKPTWLFQKSNGGKVPAIEFSDGKVLSESLIISDYLDEVQPEPPLHPKDPLQKAKDRLWVEWFSGVTRLLYKMFLNDDGLNIENFESLVKELEPFEKELTKRNTKFFAGARPGMLDLMIWPWLERTPLLHVFGGESYTLPASRLPNILAWQAAMIADEGVKGSYLTPELHSKYLASRKTGTIVFDFDESRSTRIGIHIYCQPHVLSVSMVQQNLQHLKKGDAQPPLQKGFLRLYGMRFCPYDHRVHLVLEAKTIPYDTVYINLNDKPEWFLKKSEGGKVPTIELSDGIILSESLIIADYLDEAYPEPALYPKDPRAKAEDRVLLEKFGGVKDIFARILFHQLELSPESFEILVKGIEIYEEALAQRQSVFFGGAKPGMLDLMIWPWFERIPQLEISGGDLYKLPSVRLPRLAAWSAAMLADDPIKKTHLTPQVHAMFIASRKIGSPTYDFDYEAD